VFSERCTVAGDSEVSCECCQMVFILFGVCSSLRLAKSVRLEKKGIKSLLDVDCNMHTLH